MANSRLEKVGTIYTRVRGLLKAGGMRPEDKPIWYDVYEAFPPKNLAPSTTKEPLKQIFYPEDEVRARFYREKVSNENVYLMDTQRSTRCQQFIEKYQEFAAEHTTLDKDEIFNMALETMKLNATPAEEDKVRAGDSTLAASFKNALGQNTSSLKNKENNTRINIDISEIVKD